MIASDCNSEGFPQARGALFAIASDCNSGGFPQAALSFTLRDAPGESSAFRREPADRSDEWTAAEDH